jgi:hypothetical protein
MVTCLRYLVRGAVEDLVQISCVFRTHLTFEASLVLQSRLSKKKTTWSSSIHVNMGFSELDIAMQCHVTQYHGMCHHPGNHVPVGKGKVVDVYSVVAQHKLEPLRGIRAMLPPF